MKIDRPNELKEYLRSTGRIPPDEDPRVRSLPGGVSNRTMLVERPNGDRWVIKQALEQLRVPAEWTCSPERIFYESLGLQWLQKLAPAGMVPGFLFEDREQYLLAMEAVPEHYDNWKTMLLEGRLRLGHIDIFAHLIASIHRRGYEQRSALKDDFGDWTYFEALRLEPYYSYTAAHVDGAREFLRALIRQTRQRRITLVHGDYSPKNILVDRDQLVLLDHEVIHFGDPAFDIGFSMTHLLSKSHHVLDYRNSFIRAGERFWSEYFKRVEDTGWSERLEEHAVGHILGSLLARVAGKSQLEYLSDDERHRQKNAVLALMNDRPDAVPQLIRRFRHEIEVQE